MSADESFSSSDESNSSIAPNNLDSSIHFTSNHRLANEEVDDLFPLIDECSEFETQNNKQDYWLVCKAYFSIIFLMIALISLFFLFLNHFASSTAGNEWARKNKLNETIPTYEINLDFQDRYHLFWTIDYDSETILFELKLKLTTNFDWWFAFGFSDYGLMSNADLCMIWFDKRRFLHFQDAKTDNETLVILDRNSNDCHLVHWKQSRIEGLFYLSFRRYFDTCDPEDYIIDNGTTHLVYGTGKGTLFRVESVKLSSHIHGFQRVQLLKPDQVWQDNLVEKKQNKIQILDLLVENVTIPNVETTYWCQLVKLPKIFQKKIHIIQYEAVIEEKSKHLVHHMEVFHCEIDAKLVFNKWSGRCNDTEMPNMLLNCKKVIAAWAYGASAMIYPELVGLPIGGNNFSPYVMIEVHYNNPDLKTDLVDNSGMRIYYTDELRKYDAGILEIGLEYTDKNSIPPNVMMELRGYCVSECTRVGLPKDGITIFASQLHTHLTGCKTWTEHIRGGMYLGDINRDNHYSPHFQEIRKLSMPHRVFPGDSLVHVCLYDTRQRKNVTLGGFGISDEMCVNYLHYYPKSELEVCKSSIDSEYLNKYFDFMRIYENENTSSKYPTADNYRNIHWTRNGVKKLDQLYQNAPLSIQCNTSSGTRFPGYWNGIQPTFIRPMDRNLTKAGINRCDSFLKRQYSLPDDQDYLVSGGQKRENNREKMADDWDVDIDWQHSNLVWNHKPEQLFARVSHHEDKVADDLNDYNYH